MSDIQVFYESTPNPHSLKFVVTVRIANETAQFNSSNEAQRSPLAQKILGFPWAKQVLIGPNFVSILKEEWVEWQIIADPLTDLIREHIERGLPVLLEGAAAMSDSNTDIDEKDSPIVGLIKKVLREEIRPAVAMDGGDIIFQKFEDGRVYLHMQGSCSGCPSSTYTLKQGIEVRLKEVVPEVQEVVAV